jgi:hypothetical protein
MVCVKTDSTIEQGSNVEGKKKRFRSRRFKLILVGITAVLILFALYWRLMVWPQNIFARWIFDPIPRSVTDIRVYALHNSRFMGYEFLFRFKINKMDFDMILVSRPFKQVHKKMLFIDDRLSWERDDGVQSGGSCQLPGVPKWFRPQDLPDDARAYIFDAGFSAAPQYVMIAYSNHTNQAYCYVSYPSW